jgi:hypothetical protein
VKNNSNGSSKILKKEIEEDTRRWKDLSFSLIGKINVMKMAISPKAICRFNVMLSVPMTFFTELENSVLKLYGVIKDPK